MRLVAALAFAGTLTAMPALAADKGGPPAAILPPAPAIAPSCYVQALAGSSINTVKADGALLPAQIAATGWTVGAGVGCDIKIERIVVGALARLELPVDTTGSLIESDKAWMAGFRAGYLLNTGLMVYGLVGYQQADLAIDVTKLSKDGLVLGGGLEIKLGERTSLTAEYTRAGGLDSTRLGGIDLEPVSHSARVGISYRFSGGIFGE